MASSVPQLGTYFRTRPPNLCSHRRYERDFVLIPTHFYHATTLSTPCFCTTLCQLTCRTYDHPTCPKCLLSTYSVDIFQANIGSLAFLHSFKSKNFGNKRHSALHTGSSPSGQKPAVSSHCMKFTAMTPTTKISSNGLIFWLVYQSIDFRDYNATKTLVQAFISCRLDYCNSLLFGISDGLLRCLQSRRTLPPAWSQAPVGVTTSHQCYGSCTGCQSVSALCSRSRGSYISRLSVWLPRTSQTTVAFCRTLVVAHCGPTPITFGSCLFHEHITNSVIGVSRPPVLDCGTTFHLDSGGGTYLRLFQTIFENSFIWRPKRLVTLLNL